MSVDPIALSSLVARTLDDAGHDLQRALELACAEVLCLQRVAGAGIRRGTELVSDPEAVPRLVWASAPTGDDT
jgi:hypothetical protein